jgi:hypothetical protein
MHKAEARSSLFENKEAKKLYPLECTASQRLRRCKADESFLVLFYKKELFLASLGGHE